MKDYKKTKRSEDAEGPLSAAVGEAGAGGDAAAAAAPPATASAATTAAAVSPLWLLSPESFLGPAFKLVLSKLPTFTLRSLRLVNRAARDEVDACLERVRVRVDECGKRGALEGLRALAPRLRGARRLDLHGNWIRVDDAAAAAEVPERLPGGGAALRELRLGHVLASDWWWCALFEAPYDPRCLGRLAAAVGGLTALTRLELSVEARWFDGVAAVAGAVAGLQRLAHLSVRLSGDLARDDRRLPEALLSPPPLRSLPRLETLELREGAALLWLPSLFEPMAAAPPTRLRDLRLGLSAAEADEWQQLLPKPPAATPWLSQLTRLALDADRSTLLYVARALPLGALTGVRVLEVGQFGDDLLSAATLRALLAALPGAAAALEALTLRCAAFPEVHEATATLPALRALDCGDTCAYSAAAPRDIRWPPYIEADSHSWRAFCDAPLAPLTRLTVELGHNALGLSSVVGGGGLEALARARWARGLRELRLHFLPDAGDDPNDARRPRGAAELRALRGLGGLTALTKLALLFYAVDPAAIHDAAAAGAAAGWAPRLEAFELTAGNLRTLDAARPDIRVEAALLQLPFSGRLRRLNIRLTGAVTQAELDAFSAACAQRLPQLDTLEFSAWFE